MFGIIRIELILFVLGLLMITKGYVEQVSPNCTNDLKVKIVPRDVYDDILYNQELVNVTYNDMM
tara:strand:- start:458 stop:649 length:192 start_codon:yes stop_codon:yes gene_type:complete